MMRVSDKANISRTASFLRASAALLILACLCASLCSCQMLGARFLPGEQKNAQWLSKDESVFVASDDSGETYGYAIVNGEKLSFSADFTSLGTVYVIWLTGDGDYIGYEYEEWHAGGCIRNCFELRVSSSSLFNAGEDLVLRRLKDSEKIDYELPSSSSDKDSAASENTIDKNAAMLRPVIEGHTDGTDDKGDSYIMAAGILKYGIKEICDPRIMTDYGGLITVEFTDAEGTAYSLTYDIDEHKVVKIGSIG